MMDKNESTNYILEDRHKTTSLLSTFPLAKCQLFVLAITSKAFSLKRIGFGKRNLLARHPCSFWHVVTIISFCVCLVTIDMVVLITMSCRVYF